MPPSIALPASRWMRCAAVLACLGGAALLSGCVVPAVDSSYSSTTVYTTYGYPPPPRVDYRYRAPSPRHVWQAGGWFWTGSRYDWRPGYWMPPGHRPAPPPPPPHRPHVQPPRPHQAMPAPQPRPPMLRPDSRPRPPQMRPHERPAPQQHVRPSQPRPEHARPSPQRRDEGREHRPSRRDRDDARQRS